MEEEIEFIIDSAKEAMDNAVSHLNKKFVNIRAGKASPAMVGSVMVNYYGSQTPLSQVANVATPDVPVVVKLVTISAGNTTASPTPLI